MRVMAARAARAALLTALTVGTVAAGLHAADPEPWSRFRGPNGTGVSSSTGLPAEFGPTKNVIWKAPCRRDIRRLSWNPARNLNLEP